MLNAKKIVGLSLFLCLSGIMGCSNANKQNMKLQPAIIKDDSEKINVTLDPNAHIAHIDPCHTKEKNICSMNDTVEVTFPMTMIDLQFSKKSWKHIDDRKFYIVVQYYPEKKQLLCN